MQSQNLILHEAHLLQLISIGIADGNFVLIGFPFDLGDKRAGRKPGVDYGPDCFRRFLNECGPLINPEYNIDISKIAIKDYGNISINENTQQTLENYLQKLQLKVNIVKNKYKSIPIVIGGSFDQSYACYQNLYQQNTSKNIGIICIDQNFHLEECKTITSENCISKFLSEFSQNKNNQKLKFVYFGIKSQQSNRQQQKTIKSIKKEFPNIALKTISFEDIQQSQLDESQIQNMFSPRTKAGLCFKNLIQQQFLETNEIHLTLNLQALKNKHCPGVSYQNQQEGFSSDEICEILFMAGQNRKIQGIDFSGFNPIVEDFRTGRLLINIIYYFIMGYNLC